MQKLNIYSPSVIIENAFLQYHQQVLFQNLNFTLNAAQWTVLLGRSGVGKSSLLRLIAGIPAQGSNLRGEVFATDRQSLKNRVAFLPQEETLLPWLNVMDNVLIGYRLRGQKISPDIIANAHHLLDQVGLSLKEHEKLPKQLSGGMKQRVALVRTFLEDKPIILLDEPFSALDAITRYELQDLAAKLFKNKTVLLVTHDPNEALRLGDQICVLHGSPAQLRDIIRISEPTPRSLGGEKMSQLQQLLYDELLMTKEYNK